MRSAAFLRLFRPYVRWKIGRGLEGLHVAGLDAARGRLARGPLILAANHVSWWDALLLVALDEALGGESYALMDASNLSKIPFFAWLGALPLDRGGGARARRGLEAAAGRLRDPGRAIWIFPQGRQRAAHLRPLGLRGGVRLLARLSGAPVLPVALQYGFREADRPAAAVDFGAPLPPGAGLAELEAALVAGLARADAFLEQGGGGFSQLIGARRAPAQAGWGARLLGRAAAR